MVDICSYGVLTSCICGVLIHRPFGCGDSGVLTPRSCSCGVLTPRSCSCGNRGVLTTRSILVAVVC